MTWSKSGLFIKKKRGKKREKRRGIKEKGEHVRRRKEERNKKEEKIKKREKKEEREKRERGLYSHEIFIKLDSF